MGSSYWNVGPQTEYRTELFFEMSLDLLCIAGYDGYFKLVNPAFINLLGYTNEELLASPVDSFIHPEDRNITSQYREEIKKNIPLLNYENRYITKSGDVIWLSWTSVPRPDDQLVFAIARNISHKKTIEKERNALISNLTLINHDLKQLTYTTSHDLRSPVNNLLALFGLLDISKIEDPETVEILSVLKAAADSLKDSLNNYVDILLQKDLLSVKRQEIDINFSLQAIEKSLKSLIETSRTTILTDFSAFGNVLFNATYMESIFLNLITNSIKYVIPQKTPVIRISTRIVNNVKQLIFEDEGMGFDMSEVEDRIFGLNQTFHNHIDAKGIGLYLVHNQITSLGGSITVESAPNQGTRFILSFKS
ncbi:sensor histidine kinase [Dyadobacter sp. MSC1_007]|jgi:PAS domain S-box-containing protein|uniref:sensor histidine kinase n=1 Tax=Dyadobacter sp. MSC1_007 TaxID=2909264 RepID=UPI00202FAA84|nr:PAS domain-containing sensor histidine kinase [Dyadobacter sp. MSC1_007]